MDDTDEILRIVLISYPVLVFIICLLGIIGNGLVIWFVVFKMKNMINSVWFLSLAIADFTFSFYRILCLIFILLGFATRLGIYMCMLDYFTTHLNLSASIFQLTIISIDRYVCTVFPVWCQNHRTRRTAVKVVLVMWLASLLIGLYYMIKVHNSYSGDLMSCIWREPMEKLDIIFQCIVLFALPFTIIIFCNLLTLLRIRRNIRTTSTKPFKVVAAVIISFFICWFPVNVCGFIELNSGNSDTINECPLIFFFVSTLFVDLNSSVNPFLYVFIGRDFKGKCCSAIEPAFERAFAEDKNLEDSGTHRTEGELQLTQATNQS